ncbi:T9SS type A sorting domain-containing protein [uncultured Microscilla sp.]|uniref:T9SS type A sorting domain-containing protein n=1 Tax=uncultured Microscilla sp. TaxID=432653 RepID=UPI002618A3B4|nr:T9SS type A sorting domain-containing protein [uncultured Microscilla sp.]
MNTAPEIVKDVLNINAPVLQPINVVLLNMFGQVVLNTQAQVKNGVAQIHLATLSYGTYQAQIHLGDDTLTQFIEKR